MLGTESKQSMAKSRAIYLWQDLKDYMRQAGEVTYADAHNETRGEGIVEFASRKDMEKALDMLDGCEFNGKNITLIREKHRRYPDLVQSRASPYL